MAGIGGSGRLSVLAGPGCPGGTWELEAMGVARISFAWTSGWR